MQRRDERWRMHDAGVSVLDDALAYLARCAGEEEIGRFWRESFAPRVKARLALNLSAEQHVQRFARDHDGHGSSFEIVEEPDRFVLKLHECGTGARLRKSRPDIGTTKYPHPWSWGKTGVPYYCTHCCMGWEVLAIELCGYPLRIHFCPERPEDPCVNFVYKDRAAIPQRFFTRVGMSKGS